VAALETKRRARRTSGACARVCGALVVTVAAGALPTHAKLASSKAQESAMIARIVPVTEKWLRHVNDSFDKKEPFQNDITAFARDLGSLEGGIFGDMYICTDVARLCVYAQHKDARLYKAIDDFNTAADQLCVDDKARYYAAKAKLFAEKLVPPDSLKREWIVRLVNDCCLASRYGVDADKNCAAVRRFADKSGLKDAPLDDYACRIYQDYGRFFLTKTKASGKSKDALETALQAIREIPAPSNMDFGSCGQQKSDADLLAAYDRSFVQPLSSNLGKNKDAFLVEVCKKFWQQKKLVSLALPRVALPSPDAFDLFRKAGDDDALKADPRIATAELALWKKAKKLREFKTKFPDRYRLARAAAGR
jgi:hypothetical protein